jgi:beta-phosphoglucomutase-like phosphatase (HAD superfamily)
LIFDLDGTLADTMPYHFRAWQRACARYGAHIDNKFLRRHTGSPGWIIAEEVIRSCGLNGSVSIDSIVNEKMKEFLRLQHLIKPIEPVTDIVRKYHGILPMAVGTGGHREAVEKTLEITGLRHFFEIIITANDVSSFKPHPETFLRCAELMHVDPPFIEVFEDGELGIEAAQNAGMMVTDVRSWYDSDW